MPHDVFISYSSKDKTPADAVCATLESRGIRCWIAPRDILPGADWGEAIIDAITASKVMILMYSANANTSPQIKREVERAVNKGVTVMPLRLEDVPMSKSLEYFISTPHWLDAMTPPLERHLAKLADTVGALIEQMRQPGEPPRLPSANASRPTPPPISPSRSSQSSSKKLVAVLVPALLLILVAIGGILHDRDHPTPLAASQPASSSSATNDHALALSHLHNGVAALEDLDDVQAKADFDEAIRLDPNLGEAYWQRGRVEDNQGNPQQAKADRDNALKLGYRPPPEQLTQWAMTKPMPAGSTPRNLAPGRAIVLRMERNIVQERLSVTLTDEPAGPRITLMRVDPTGIAAQAGFKAGDVIEQPSRTAPNLVRVLSDPVATSTALRRPDGQIVTMALPPVSAESAHQLAFARQRNVAQGSPDHTVLLPPDVLFAHSGATPAAPSQPTPANSAAELAAIRAELSIKLEKYDDALADYTDAIAKDPSNASYRIGRGQVLFHMGKNEDAIADYTEAIRLAPENSAAYRLRSLAYTAAGDPAKAQADSQSADRLDSHG